MKNPLHGPTFWVKLVDGDSEKPVVGLRLCLVPSKRNPLQHLLVCDDGDGRDPSSHMVVENLCSVQTQNSQLCVPNCHFHMASLEPAVE